MYKGFRQLAERLLRIPPDPEPPPGDESSTRVFRASPKFLKYLLVVWGLQTALFLLPILAATAVLLTVSILARKEAASGPAIVIGISIFVLLCFLLHRLFRLAVLRLDYEKRWYVVTDRSLRVREGVVQVQEMTITFANIQNLSISEGPIQRLLGLADLRVDTAGGGGGGDGHSGHLQHDSHTAWLRGIDNASEVRALIQERLRQLKDSGLGDHEEVAERLPAVPDSRLIEALARMHHEAVELRLTASRIGSL
jgi:membrane protein YdbS with pleckstrin-like domain